MVVRTRAAVRTGDAPLWSLSALLQSTGWPLESGFVTLPRGKLADATGSAPVGSVWQAVQSGNVRLRCGAEKVGRADSGSAPEASS